MKKVIKNNYKIIIGFILGLIVSITTVYAVDAYIESNKVTYNNHNKNNVQEAIDELYEKSGMHKEKWIDPVLNGADPVLKEPLIPVEIKPNGEVYYANLNSEWYNYSEKRWANAVILIDNPSNTNYKAGDHIIEDDIESYFVWIPRYQYKIWDLGNYTNAINTSDLVNSQEDNDTSYWNMFSRSRIIDVRFGMYDKYPKMTEPTLTGTYYTHPAFTLGDKNLNGIWVGKFETGYRSATDSNSAKIDKEDSDSVIIKPDVYSWRSISAKNIFMTSYNYKRELDSHMMKNTEWGATAYLSHSSYGIGNKININNNSKYMTGYSSLNASRRLTKPVVGSSETVTQPWDTATGYLASTTGNINGIYDMCGGRWEYVSACIEGVPGSDSGFDTVALANEMNNGYIDKYDTTSTSYSFDKRILGDATGEMGPYYNFRDADKYTRPHNSWYADMTFFVSSSDPWFIRGGSIAEGGVAGQFATHYGNGANSGIGFRLVLAPTK